MNTKFGAARCQRLQRQLGAQAFSSFVHADETVTVGSGVGGIQSDAIVADGKLQICAGLATADE